MNLFEGAIFDVDGTLLDSNDPHARAYQKAFEEAGLRFPYSRIRRLIGMGGDHLIPALSGIAEESERGQAIARRKKEIFFNEYLSELEPFPEARDLVEALRDRGVRVAIASSASDEELERFLGIVGIDQLVEARAPSDAGQSSKPDPDVVQAAVRQLALPPGKCLMIGDTPYDIEAARKAWLRSIAFRSGGWSDQDLGGAIAIYHDPSDMLMHLDDSPFFRDWSGFPKAG